MFEQHLHRTGTSVDGELQSRDQGKRYSSDRKQAMKEKQTQRNEEHITCDEIYNVT